MNDLSICKRIAEIEGYWWVTDRGCYLYIMKDYAECKSHPLPTYYNPLTDDALCFQLMVKYDIRVESFEPNLKDGSDGYEYHCYKQGALNYARNTLSISESPNKAICLAIIETHKES